ncbi:ABC transporter permease [candidate division WS5 bacterium]|uniref:Cell division protein FtsX n=1 Tax=candidate division WS5 bacterium TaxID=2093353 RepID=A0A419DA44_9BACT|nr:MAG: ABC transporter permease [candidate division WS5 bacterium]
MFTTFYRLIKTGFTNFLRNGWLSLASTIIMTLTLITISIFLILNIVLTQGIQTIQDKIDISVYLNDNAKGQIVLDLQEELSNNKDVKKVRYISKDEAKQRYQERFKNNPQLKESLEGSGENPLPASLEVKTYDPEKLESLLPVFEKEEYKSAVRKVSYKDNKEVIDRLFKATEFIKKIGWGLGAAFIITSLIIIFNTIRTAIYTHRDEIEIMKLVGANPWFIRWPFLIEGILYGVLGTLLALIAISITLRLLAVSFNTYFGEGDTGDQVFGFLLKNLATLIVLMLGVGIAIGVTSSSVAIRKYLKKS